ncbi:hypothetical protein C4K68_28010 [Pokkaliibacter plantistimulans]|uniref:AB hydrolase-1 domain-containing protein n=1 Tax=Proteobacteria bacterium 228 TaxID=2083153 RepID=A0A2S5KHJ6_9PROT|nr:alpha/beta hydrolase [Pokkaliibacter plantistimulans]PPC73969.1 hypothetical protein C4K68_28010 [Pokkaliibacter plantistimulans]
MAELHHLQPSTASVVTLAGTLLPPWIFRAMEWPSPWQWQPIDWLKRFPATDLDAIAAALLPELEQQCQQHPVVIIGHSAGGVLAQQLASALGPRLRGLILTDTGACASQHGDPDLPRRMREHWGSAFMASFFERCTGKYVAAQLGAELADYALSFVPAEVEAAMTSLRRLDLRPRLADITCPTLIVHGRFDRARQLAHAEELANGIAGAELQLLECGHSPMLELPQAYHQLISQFLQHC